MAIYNYCESKHRINSQAFVLFHFSKNVFFCQRTFFVTLRQKKEFFKRKLHYDCKNAASSRHAKIGNWVTYVAHFSHVLVLFFSTQANTHTRAVLILLEAQNDPFFVRFK